jgi:hypothetical protein
MKVPFKIGIVHIERNIDFVFGFDALEIATEEVLNCELKDVAKQDTSKLNVAILYAAYLSACRKNYKKPKFNESHAAFWMQYMGEDARKELNRQLNELFGKMKGEGSDEKKKT